MITAWVHTLYTLTKFVCNGFDRWLVRQKAQDYSLVVGCESLLFIAISRRKENRDDIFKESGGSDGFSQNPNVIRLCGVVFRRQGLNMWGGF